MNQDIFPDRNHQGPIAFLVRHAERHPIERMINALEIQLTERGKKDAYQMGRMLSRFCPMDIYHSPVPRCKQTAESIYEGINSLDQRVSNAGYLLDLGGPYITGDWSIVAAEIEKQGHAKFIRRWFNNEHPASLIMSLPEAARIQLNILATQLVSSTSSSVNVTHDWNIMILREYYFQLRHEDIGDPDYLDGLHASLSDGKILLRYHEHERSLDMAEIER